MKTAEKTSTTFARSTPVELQPMRSAKIRTEHLEKLAIVYVRQSTQQQVLDHRESTARQYALVHYAERLGWPAERVLLIDEDQGLSGKVAENRLGFQRLLAEVTMEHVGVVMGLELNRLARNSRDWHQLFELCGIFGTLLADQEGVYDANDPNDRLLLGLKGIMSEMELQTMQNRLHQGRLNKAQRGEMFHRVPTGYVLLPTGKVDFDPDEHVREVIRLIFDKFEEIGSVYGLFYWLTRNDIRLPIRSHRIGDKGALSWRWPNIATLTDMLRHPIYAGAYAYPRRPTASKRHVASGKRNRPWVSMDQWKVLLKDRLPAYISWDQYLRNRQRIEHNRFRPSSAGASRNGTGLLSGVLICGKCNRRMQTVYHRGAHYLCNRRYVEGTVPRCYGLSAGVLDELVSQQVLRALEPAALELSLRAQADVERERQRLNKHWQQQLKRAHYDVELAERRYGAVDPQNRQVASTLEQRWEEALGKEREVREDYDRFLSQTPLSLSDEERVRIESLASEIPILWNAAGTTNADRKEMVRCIVERVVVHVRCDSDLVDATIHWAGGYESHHEISRPVATYAQLRDFEPLMNRIAELRAAGKSAVKIAEQLNAEGFHPPKHRGSFTRELIWELLDRRGLIGNERSHDELLGRDEWWVSDLARKLAMSHMKLRYWAKRGWVHCRKTPIQGHWILWADQDEQVRLYQLLTQSRRGVNTYTNELRMPKERPTSG